MGWRLIEGLMSLIKEERWRFCGWLQNSNGI